VLNSTSKTVASRPARAARAAWAFTLTLLAIEFLDELVFGVEGAVLPVIRADLALTYAEIGVLLSLPALAGNLIEPALGILGDVWRRKALIVGGGLAFALALLLIASGQTFAALLIAFVVFNPASGAFVNLSQATLMDLNPTRHEHMMARWALAGSLGVVAGPLIVSAALSVALGLSPKASSGGWRGLFAALAVFTLILVWRVLRQPDFNGHRPSEAAGFRAGVMSALRALRNRNMLRWLVLLEFADLLLDIFLGFIALYFVDVVHVTEAQAALAVAVWSTAGLIGDALIIPLLERVPGLVYLRWSALVTLVVYIALLIVPDVTIKYALLACLGLSISGWYAILRGKLYSAMPGQSGATMAISSVSGIVAGLIPLALGLIAQRFGLAWAMALLALGPISLLVGLPRQKR
jgi:FSR family fosmidomycin resistance protein-like MFS transporter